jgi:protein-disulfide isomerase
MVALVEVGVRPSNKQEQNRAWLAALLGLMLLLTACSGETVIPRQPASDVPTITIEDDFALDCVKAGTCAEAGEDATHTPTTTQPPEPSETYDGMTVGFTDEGYPYLGDPDAPVTLVEFSDYLCPFCGRHFVQTTPLLIDQYVRTGQIKLVFRDFPLAELHPTAPSGHAAAVCVAEQGAALFWAYHNELFARQGEWSSVPDNSGFLAVVAGEIGADLDVYRACIASGRTVPMVEQRVAQGRALGFSGTPSFHIVDNRNDETYQIVGAQPLEVFNANLDAAIAGEAPVVEDETQPAPDLPFWASADGHAPDPERPGYNLAGDAYQGDPSAPLVVVEISDFQCPFCARHSLETQPAIDERYVDTGQVMWVFKNFPLAIHPQAPAAAAAAECAGEQGAFWEMHDLLFEAVEEWSVEPPDAVLGSLAAELGLDQGAFAACLGGRVALERVLDDLFDLTSVFSTTPTFVVLFEGQASVIEGAQPLEQFIATFDGLLGE